MTFTGFGSYHKDSYDYVNIKLQYTVCAKYT